MSEDAAADVVRRGRGEIPWTDFGEEDLPATVGGGGLVRESDKNSELACSSCAGLGPVPSDLLKYWLLTLPFSLSTSNSLRFRSNSFCSLKFTRILRITLLSINKFEIPETIFISFIFYLMIKKEIIETFMKYTSLLSILYHRTDKESTKPRVSELCRMFRNPLCMICWIVQKLINRIWLPLKQKEKKKL